jgi:hypothetical protein
MAKVKVRYKGLSDERIIGRKDLADRNISVPKDLVFNQFNFKTMIIDMNDDLEQVLRGEGTFTISAVTDQETDGLEVVEATKLDDTADAAEVRDETTGQRSRRS